MEVSDVKIDIKEPKPKPKPSTCLVVAVIILAVFLVIALLLIILFAAGVIATKPTETVVAKQPKQCSTRACTQVSGRILGSMDLSADPCTDWFQYACGGYKKKSYIPIGKDENSPFSTLVGKLSAFFGDQLSDSPSSINTDDPPAFQNLKELYQGCMNKTKRSELALKPLEPYVQKFGGLGVGGTFKAPLDLTKLLTVLTQYGVEPFVQVASLVNPYKTSMRELAVYPQAHFYSVMPPDASALNPIFTGVYTAYLGKTPDTKKMADITKAFLDFKKAEPKFDPLNMTSAFQTKMSLKELSGYCCKGLNWPKFLSAVLGKTVTESFEVYVGGPEALKAMNEVIEKMGDETLHDVALTFAILSLSPYLSGDDVKYDMDTCLAVAKDVYRLAFEALFLKKFYRGTKETRKEVTDLMTYVFEAFLEDVSQLTWLGEETKKKIKLKASRTARLISHPPILTDIAWVEKRIAKGISRDEFFDGVMKSKLAKQKFLMSTAGKEWIGIMSPSFGDTLAEVNAYYLGITNTFQISAGILSEPVFTNGAPMYVNYGSLGSIVGHEISHGYDTTGGQYDPAIVKTAWWEPSELDAFQKSTKCFVNQFDKLTVHLEKEDKTYTMNGNLTLAENIADAGGIRAGFKGYEIWRKENGDEPMLVGMPKSMTWQKLFFLSAVQAFCEIVTEKGMDGLMKDIHTPPLVRVRTWVLNSDDFAKAFSCKKGTPMNPTKKCHIW